MLNYQRVPVYIANIHILCVLSVYVYLYGLHVRASKNDLTKPTVLPRQILHVMLKSKFLTSKKSTGHKWPTSQCGSRNVKTPCSAK